jgi:hypothetical protein
MKVGLFLTNQIRGIEWVPATNGERRRPRSFPGRAELVRLVGVKMSK